MRKHHQGHRASRRVRYGCTFTSGHMRPRLIPNRKPGLSLDGKINHNSRTRAIKLRWPFLRSRSTIAGEASSFMPPFAGIIRPYHTHKDRASLNSGGVRMSIEWSRENVSKDGNDEEFKVYFRLNYSSVRAGFGSICYMPR